MDGPTKSFRYSIIKLEIGGLSWKSRYTSKRFPLNWSKYFLDGPVIILYNVKTGLATREG